MTTNLARIINVYVRLMQNDGVENPAPLSIYLTTRTRFSTQLTDLIKAAGEQKGLSQLDLFTDQSLEDDEEAGRWDEDENTKQDVNDDIAGLNDETIAKEDNEAIETDLQESRIDDAQPVAVEQTESAEQADESAQVNQYAADAVTLDEESVSGVTGQIDASAVGPELHLSEETGGRQLDEDTETYGEEYANGEVTNGNEDGGEQLEYAEEAEQGEGGSSGSSTVQGEIHPDQTRGYHSPFDDEESLIDYSDNEDVYSDPSSNTAQGHDIADDQASTNKTAQNGPENGDEASGHTDPAWMQQDAYAEFTEHQDNGFADATYDDAGKPERDEDDAGEVDLEQADQSHNQEKADHEQADESWDLDGDDLEANEPAAASNGTFQVPDEPYEDEDEITYDEDDDLTIANEQVNDATEEQSPKSPLGKRSRDDDDGDDWLDGSDQGVYKRIRV